MKVLYIGHYRESSGWAKAAIDYILAMDSVGIDIACRNVSLTGREGTVPPKILELENKPIDDCDVCIQHVLPHHLVGTEKFKRNIAFFVCESSSIKTLPWFVQLQQMDEVWVPNDQMWNSLVSDGLCVPNSVKVIPHTFDINQYKKKNTDIQVNEIHSKFKFYYIGDLNARKNLESIIRCFHSEFEVSEQVALILKVKKFGHNPQQVSDIVTDISAKVKQSLRMFPENLQYHKEVIISDEVDDAGIRSIHSYGDCFVSPTHGEAWSIPSFDAMAYGNTPICSNFGGPRDFVDPEDKSTGWCVDGSYGVCECPDAAFPEIFTGREEWFMPSESEIKKAMRYYFENRHSIDRKAGKKRAELYSYENIGNKIKDILNV